MNRDQVLRNIHETLLALSREDASFPKPPSKLEETLRLADLGITLNHVDRFSKELQSRTGVFTNVSFMLAVDNAVTTLPPGTEYYTRISHLVDHILSNARGRNSG